MFGNFPAFASIPSQIQIDPKDIPPATPITLPRYQPFANDDDPVPPSEALSSLLQHTGRSPAILGPLGLSAIGLNLNLDAKLEDIIPDPDYVPNFREWDKLSLDQAREQNQSTRRPLRNGNASPGCQTYLERKNELSNSNEDAFRTVRRIQPPRGKQQARLGNTYEFFRCLEAFTSFWDDPTQPPPLPPSPEISSSESTDSPNGTSSTGANYDGAPAVVRSGSGSSMPADYRIGLLNALIKLVSYDFGCNVTPSRVEPRLHLSSPEGSRKVRKTYCASGCTFIFQSPQTREAARAGMVYGPLAAVSARGTIDFTGPDMEMAQAVDLAREMVAALITAQHRAREGKTEVRFGDGQWWTKEKRWGGGPGGPIGREVDKDAVQGDKDAKPTENDGKQRPASKRPRKNMIIYDSYRMIRPPASTWDRKTQYEAIGKQQDTDYDDVFVVSSLFHHVSILRVRVPDRLLEVLQGSREQDLTKRSWGKVEAWRSPWYDLFETEQRLAALQLLWGLMAYQMRKDTGGESEAEDVDMSNA